MTWNEIGNCTTVQTVLIGDSILKKIAVPEATTLCIPGAQIYHYLSLELLEFMGRYENVIVASLGGNNLRRRDGAFLMQATDVAHDLEILKLRLEEMGCHVILSTVCARFDTIDGSQREDIQELNKIIMDKKRFQYFNMHKYVYSPHRDFQNDGIHLSDIGVGNYCKGIKNLRKLFEI